MTGTFAGFSLGIGLAGLAGFRAFVPLVIISLVARFARVGFFRPQFQVFSSLWVILLLLFFLVIELISAKMPSGNSFQDFAETIAKILAGAFVFAALFSGIGILGGMLVGGVIAGLGVLVRSILRPFLLNTFDGLNSAVVNAIEDLIAFVGTVLIILIPAVSMLVIAYIIYLAFKRFRQQQKRPGTPKRTRVLR